MQEENESLKDIIRGILKAADGNQQLNSELTSALTRAKQAVGSHQGCGESDDGSRPSSQTGCTLEPGADDHDVSAKSLDQAFEKSFNPTHPEDVYSPPSVSPYLGDGMFTIAGRLFWDHMAYIDLQLRKHVKEEKFMPRHDPSDPRAQDIEDYDNVVAVGKARLDYYRRLNQPLCSLGDDPDPLTRLLHRQKTLKENALARRAEFWKNPKQVAEMIVGKLSREEGHALMAAISGRLSAREQRIAGQRLACYARNAISFEDGPHWSVLFVSLHLGSYVPISHGEITPTTHPNTLYA